MTTEAAGGRAPEPADEGKSPGVMLRRERERRGLSVRDVADELHLDRGVVETIEADRFLALGAPVYARGHLRKYAQLLDLPPETVLACYESLSEAARLPPPAAIPVPVVAATSSDRRFSVWIALGALAVSVAALAIWKVAEVPESERRAARPARTAASDVPKAESRASSAATPEAVAEALPVAAAPAAEEPAVAPAATAASAPATATVPAPAPPAPAPVAAQQTPPAPVLPEAMPEPAEAERVELLLDFTEASWVEVYDSAGSKLMFDIGQPGSPRKLSGSAPLTVLLGKADAVLVTADGQQLVVPRRAGREAARFTVAAGGAVR